MITKKITMLILIKKMTNNKIFWRTVKPLQIEISSSSEKMTLVENKLITENKDNAEPLNLFSFSNVVYVKT